MINSNLTKKSESPSSLNSPLGSAACNKQEPLSFEWAPSVQSDLFNYLKPHQKAALKPYLRLIKRDYQEKLCISLLDYLEGHGLDTFTEPVLCKIQEEIVEVCHLHPLTSSRAAGSKFQVSGFRSVSEPKCIGTLIKQLFPSLSHLKRETGEAL